MSKARTIRCYDYVNHPYEAVCNVLNIEAPLVFRDATKAAAVRARTVATELEVNIAGLKVGKDVAVSVETIEERPKEITSPPTTCLHLEWEAHKMPQLFPFMKAQLCFYPLTATETQLDFAGKYEAPLGFLGDALDAVVGHRIAEASVHRFIRNVAEHLRSELSKQNL